MKTTVYISNKPVIVELSSAAKRALQQVSKPISVEMELYFSCLVRKKVRFHYDDKDTELVAVTDGLAIRFRPVMTESCSLNDLEGDAPPVTDFPIANPAAFVPHWLKLHFKKGQWQGEFGYSR